MVEQGKTPLLSWTELTELGFQLVLHPLGGLFSAARALQQSFGDLMANQTAGGNDATLLSFAEFNDLIGLPHRLATLESIRTDVAADRQTSAP